ncbi:unconventional prefoldin RPB5 interactor 1 isoform 2-T2 [Glossophaga mutica]
MEAPPGPAPLAAASASAPTPLRAAQVARLREEQEKVATHCRESIQHWRKVDSDYRALQERLGTLPDKLSYSVMVPFGPFAFMPGKLVHTNEVTVLLGDNWFAKCSAKQAVGLAEHRKAHVRRTIDDLKKVMENFESRVEFTEDLQKMSDAAGDIVDIREEVKGDFEFKAKHRIAHKPHSKPKTSDGFEAARSAGGQAAAPLADEALWARLEELERREALLGELDSEPGAVIANGEDAASSEEETEGPRPGAAPPSCGDGDAVDPGLLGGGVNGHADCSVNGSHSYHSDEEEEEEEEDGDEESEPVHQAFGAGHSCVPTIYFSHTVEPKRVRINTGKNTTLKFSEKKEEAKRKRKNSCGGSHPAPELPAIRTPADIYRVFVDVVNGEYIPRKSILKSRSRENSVCSDTSESSAADLEERRGLLRGLSWEEAACSDAGESVLEEEPPAVQALSGTVIEKDAFLPCSAPRPAGAPPLLPPIPERKESPSEAPEAAPKRVSKFRAARLQQQN